MTEYIVKLTYLDGGAAGKAVRDAAKIQGALGPLEKMGGVGGGRRGGAGRDPAVAYLQDRQRTYKQQMRADADYTRAWARELDKKDRVAQKSSAAADRAAAQDAKKELAFSSYRIRVDRSQRAAKERAESKETAALAREQAKRDRISDAAAKIRERAHERAAQKDYYGGHKSIGDLFRSRASEKTKGLVTGSADSVLSAPGNIARGALGAAGTAVSLVGDATMGIANFAYQLGSAAVSAQAMREASVEGFKAIYGMAVDSDKLFDSARVAAQQTKFDTKDVVKIYSTLAANNFTADELPKYFNAVADIESAREGKGDVFLNSISRLRGNKTATYGTFKSAGLQGAGIENVFDELAKLRGIGKDTKDNTWRKLFKDGKVSREQALEAVTNSVAHKYDTKTGQLGEYSQAQGGSTFSGVISNIKNAMPDILNMKLPEDHAIFKFRDVLRALGAKGGLFDSTSERGMKFGKIVSDFVEDVFMPFGGLDLGKTNNIMDQLLNVAGQVELKFKSLMTTITKAVTDALGDGSNNILKALGQISFDIGIKVSEGMWAGFQGLMSGAGKAAGSATENAFTAPGTFGGWAQDKIDQYGPASWKRGGEGWHLPSPWGDKDPAVPSMASGGIVPGAYGSPQMVQMHGGEVVPGLRGEYMGAAMAAYGGKGSGGKGSGGNNYSVQVVVNVQGGGDPVQTAQLTAAQLEVSLDRYFGRLTAQGG